jgi:hypothetical protein
MATQVTDQEIKSFVRKVQNQLAGLKSDDLRELTENLEADLLDRREAEGAKFNLGDAKAYANELIEAAGLLGDSVEVSRLNIEFLKIWKATLDYFRTLSPAWAIVRGWLLFALVYTPVVYGRIGEIPTNARDWIVLVALVALNIWLTKKQFAALKYPLVIVNVLMLVGTPVVIADVATAVATYEKYKIFEMSATLVAGGRAINAVCALDEYGNRTQVSKLLDQDGYPIYIAEEKFIACG